MGCKIKKVERAPMTIGETLYVKELLRGMVTTNRHFWRNWLVRKQIPTLCYPEQKRSYPQRWRGLHRLTYRQDGTVRCVACMLCATNCPSRCITIVAEPVDDPHIEKKPASFQIDLLKCVWCGFCVEACPCDAIRMDTGVHAQPVFSRGEAITNKEDLLKRGCLSSAKQGGRNV